MLSQSTPWSWGCAESAATSRLRNRPGLEGAVERSRSHADYENADIFLQAAVLAHGIAEGQHFTDGNKRTALEALRVFLLINGWQVTASQPDRAAWILDLANGGSTEALAARLRKSSIEEPNA